MALLHCTTQNTFNHEYSTLIGSLQQSHVLALLYDCDVAISRQSAIVCK
jgi:hypothetical protein